MSEMFNEPFSYRTASQVVEGCKRMAAEWTEQAENETDPVMIETCQAWVKKWEEAAEYAEKNKPRIRIGGLCRRQG